MNNPESVNIQLVYDKQCPACEYYCNLVRIRHDFGTLQLIDARENETIMQDITEHGFNIDQGIVLIVGKIFYYGPEAIHRLSLLSTQSGWFNRLNYLIFQSAYLSKVIYPVLKTARNLLLKFMGKTKINNLGLEGNRKF